MAGFGFRCAICGEVMDLDGLSRWVAEAERHRDDACSRSGSFAHADREFWQREVYRRRRILYEAREVPPATVRPEMILVLYDAAEDVYRCRIFYREPRPPNMVESVDVRDNPGELLRLRTDPDPGVRMAAERVEEFGAVRKRALEDGLYAPLRRVFYTNGM
ncbi:hypothetical protein [Rubrobacter calidifluminis]|uniref:hypothetical protein n=1 Tax=Rubrobacter calidifluminis TaxID=1392640 RepID=UPI00236245C1|nr:hypothetical protein [Rubrobacter calidifluminis]